MCYERSVQNSNKQFQHLMELGNAILCIHTYGMGSLHILQGSMDAKKYLSDRLIHMFPSRHSPGAELTCLFTYREHLAKNT